MFHARNGAIFSKNSTFVFFDGASPITENGIQLRSPSPIMAPVYFVNATSPKCETWQIDFPNSNLKAVKKSRQSEKVTSASRNTLRDPVKMVTRPIVVRNNFQRVLDIIWIKLIRH